ncbi:hypothetical protein CPB84DRAFT_653203 [Gymnopilus junonius]|uniref:Uncharacterized protein n=1 Tax=Gymnopilus junonius TaxID=109634 RepID=A0A9P5TQ53_GYMJU|nr:hypothetical protein CPB84DRAFT_653203 [Gymnopilus junonius]
MNESEPTSAFKAAASFLPTLNFGNGLIEIAALTTLIGSSTAGDLILGNRGAAGLVWGSISAFGSSSVIKACASAASPGWLRQMLGLRTPSSDKAMGMDLFLAPGKKVAKRMRGTLDDPGPLGVSCLSDDPDGTPMEKSPKIKEHHTYRDIYAFDSTTSVMLSELSSTSADSPPVIHTHYHYAFYRPHHLRFQITVLSLSLFKALEIYTLLTQGGILVSLLSGIPFLFSFVSGVCLEVHDIITARRPVEVDGHLDLVAASPLPTTKRVGGPKKVVLGASPNTHTGPWWKFFWIVTGTLQTLTIVFSYFLLGQQRTEFVFVWAGFQLFWVIARILIFNLTEHTHPMSDRPMKGSRLESLSSSMKLRVANLVLAVGNYQAHMHPRNIDAYLDDSFSTRQIARLLAPENMSEVFPLQPRHARAHSNTSLNTLVPSPSTASFSSSSLSVASEKTLSAPAPRTSKVNILAVIGDTALSSAAWMLGNSKFGPMDLYDSCIVVFEVTSSPLSSSTTINSINSEKPTSRIVAVPSARVFSARSQWFDIIAASNEDALEPLFIPRGAGSQVNADEKTWLYWVPCENGEWLQIKSTTSLSAPSTSTSSNSLSTSPSASNPNLSSTPPSKPSSLPRLGNTSTAKVYSVLGHQLAEVLDDKQLSGLLGAGKLNISLKDAQEVRGVVDVSRRASEALMAFLR